MSDVSITYKGQSIATMDATGSKTLQTQGKYCEGDIGVEYVKPAGPSGTKQISITQNGTVTEDVAAYANAEISVNVQGGGGWTTEEIATNTGPSGIITVKNQGGAKESVGAYAFAGKPVTGLVIDMDDKNAEYRFSNSCFLQSPLASVSVINNSQDAAIRINNAFASTKLVTFDFPNTKINFGGYTNAFSDCKQLTRISVPRAYGSMLTPCTRCERLEFADMGEATQINTNGFLNCYVLQTLILRSANLVALGAVGAFTNTPLRGYNGLTATVYVPQALIESYKAATNWSTIFNEGHLTFAAIEGSAYDT